MARNENEEEYNSCQKNYNNCLKSLRIITNVTIGTIVIYNLYHINLHLIELKYAIEHLF
jgi:hypothetical protein